MKYPNFIVTIGLEVPIYSFNTSYGYSFEPQVLITLGKLYVETTETAIYSSTIYCPLRYNAC
ncbi:MAG: hypothetical protein KME29_14315 [Calothrix sp. FI2-JRJ7]|nr:hypothetical protein [Calothrix sp. FI2-JRJ7]